MIFQMLRSKIYHSENDAENTKPQCFGLNIIRRFHFPFLTPVVKKGKSKKEYQIFYLIFKPDLTFIFGQIMG